MPTSEMTTRIPLYEQVREQLRDRCLAEAGGMLPSLRQLSQDMEVNHLTVSRALRDLEEEGLVEVVPRKGIFINSVRQKLEKVELITFFSEKQNLLDIAACVMQGMKEESEDAVVHGRSLSVPPVPAGAQLLESFREQEVSAVIFLGAGYLGYPGSLYESLLIHEVSQQMPAVIVGCPVENLLLDCVYGDPCPQLREYLDACYQKGLRRFAYLGSHIPRLHFQERVETFKEFLLDSGIRRNRDYFPPETQDSTVSVQNLLSQNPMPEVVIAANLHYAFTVVMEAQRRNLTPGKDIHILCFASIEEDARPILPYATVILLDEVAMGRRAFAIAHQRLLENKQGTKAARPPQCERLPARFLNRLL